MAYRGRARTLQALLREPPHSLEVQSYAPKEMEGALLNADGFGVVWYVEGQAKPARYRSVLPMWGDENLPELAPRLTTGCLVANARSATPGLGMGLANTPPFVHGRWTFSHNGYVRGFRERVMRPLRAGLSDEAYQSIRGSTDSEHLFAVFLDAVRDASPEDALQRVVDRVRALAPEDEALLSVLVSDGSTLWALRHALGGKAPTLYHCARDGDVFVASEPLDGGPWAPVPAGTVARFDGEVTLREVA